MSRQRTREEWEALRLHIRARLIWAEQRAKFWGRSFVGMRSDRLPNSRRQLETWERLRDECERRMTHTGDSPATETTV